MKLKKLELIGFKSFADRTVFTFDGPFTALVGPNGSGKSNVVDALKWVLGERSAKKLRGNEMSDMIFNGSSSRAALGTAEVRVTLDNSDGQLPVDYEEVTISRQCYRSGESDYSMNGEGCRLKDVRNLLMDTGIGVSAYSFIEQGQVDRLLQASSSERREVLEEAAGINQYLERKREAERKLDRVKSNLQRVTDIVEELERQLRSVRRQARRARRYKRYTDELERLRLALGIRKKRRLTEKRTSLEDQIEKVAGQKKNVTQDLEERRERLENTQDELESLREKLSEAEDRLSKVGARKYSLKREIDINQKRCREVRQRQEELENRREEASDNLTELRTELQETEAEIEKGAEKLEKCREECREQAQDLKQMREEGSDLEERVETVKSNVFELMQKESQLQNRIKMLRSEKETLSNRLQRQKQKKEDTSSRFDELKKELEQNRKERGEFEKKLNSIRAELEDKRAKLAGEQDRVEKLSARISHLQADLQGKRSRQQVLQDLQERAEGVGSGVRELLERVEEDASMLGGCPGLLANLFEVDTRDALAVEAALGHLVQAVAVESPEQAREALRILREGEKGRAEVLPLEQMAGRDAVRVPDAANNAEKLTDLVDCGSEELYDLRCLLADCLVVDTVDEAMKLMQMDIDDDTRIVTRQGDCIVPGGTWAAGEPESGSMIGRRSELADLEEEIAQMEQRIEELKEERAQRKKSVCDIEESVNNLSCRRAHYSDALNETGGDISVLESKIERRGEDLTVIESEIVSLREDLEATEEKQKREREELNRIGSERAECQEELDQMKKRLQGQRQKREELSEELNELRSNLGRIEEQQKSRRNLADRLKDRIEKNETALDRISREKKEGQKQIEEAKKTIEQNSAKREELKHKEKNLEQKVETISSQMTDRRSQISSLREEVDNIQGRRERCEEQLQDLRMEENESRLKLENLYERVAEEWDINLQVLELQPEHWEENPLYVEGRIEEYHDPEPETPTVAEWYQRAEQPGDDREDAEEVKLISLEDATRLREEVLEIVGSEDTEWKEIEDRANELHRKVENMGGANLDAIDEQEELEVRAEFLSNQQDDLEQARQHELEIIRELSRKSRENFLDTFNAVRENFQTLIRKLFGGGSGDIMLEDDADDVLEAGIEIKVRPPGKETRSITLLSGGEKALSAVALLFSIFKARPSPFCLLDEVDAPLDEANVGRFLGMLEDYNSDTQFVVVTHNKTTMSAAETLYGISLQEDGVSKKVAVNFEEVDRQLDEMERETRLAETRARAG
ncbi:MAG: chromosome segregation protein SMC [Candidatus Brocadiia bacterium]